MPDRAAFYTANLKFRGDEIEKRRPNPGEAMKTPAPMKTLLP